MESSVKDKSIPISLNDVYKIHILNELGDVERVFVFAITFIHRTIYLQYLAIPNVYIIQKMM